MSISIISPAAGSPAGAIRGADGRGEGQAVGRGQPGLEGVERVGQRLGGSRRRAGARRGGGFGLGVEPVARLLADDRVDAGFLPPDKALAAQRDPIRSIPRESSAD